MKTEASMTHEEAGIINCIKVLKALKFMIKMSTHGISLDDIGFKNTQLYGSTKKVETYSDDMLLHTTTYTYCSNPSIVTKFGDSGGYPTFISATTNFVGDVRHHRFNHIIYDEHTKDWKIRLEVPEPKFHISIDPGDCTEIRTARIDLSDEGEVFQYSLMETNFPMFTVQAALEGITMLRMKPGLDDIVINGGSVVVDLGILDLEEEYKKKQTSFNNF